MTSAIERAVERVLIGSEEATTNSELGGTLHKIVVCQRGFVYAGDVRTDGEYLVVANAVNLRRWGTKKGLGELALNGPNADLKADDSGTVRVHKLAVVLMLDCKKSIGPTT